MITPTLKLKNLAPALLSLSCAFALLQPAPAQAHPHEFVTMEVTAKFDFDGNVSGLTYNWAFDEFFTAYAVDGQDQNKNGVAEQNELNALLDEILGNIQVINYFTVFDKKAAVPKLAKAQPLAATLKERQLQLSFYVPFKAAVSLEKTPLRFSIYDDEFYIAMNFEPKSYGKIVPATIDNCTAGVDLADPDEDVMAFASSLGRDENSGGGLGASFAEWVTIKCN
ncbi:MAG: DUF1007 family protein [Rhizobiaceae bacterium]